MAKASLGAILHFAAVRFKVLGSGNLRIRTMDDAGTGQVLVPQVMSQPRNREENVLCNVRNYSVQFEFKVTAIDEYFTITTIRIFAKESSTGYPQ